MPVCAAVSCSNRFEDGFRLFLLPTDERRKKQWLVNMGRETWTPSKITSVCEAHFDDSQWVQNHAAGWKKLKPYAIPTLFDNPTLPVTLSETDVFQICRVCLKVDDDLIDLFKPMSNNEEPYLELMEHTSLRVSSDDGLPPYICKECFETLQTIKNFKIKCIRSNNLLKNYNGTIKIENLNENTLSKTQTKDIWYIDNKDNLETTTVDKQNHKEKTEKLNNKNGDKLDEIIDLTFDEPVKKTKQEEYSVCYICGKKVVNLNYHLNSHNDSLNYKCEICGKEFRTYRVHQMHLLVHKNRARFECGICHKTFSRYGGRKRHIQTVHEQTRPFKCTLCTKSFHLAHSLRIHMVTHTGERKHKCDVQGCTQQYAQRTPLVQHKLRCHSNKFNNCPKKLKKKRPMKRPEKCNKSLVSNRKLKKVPMNTIEKQETETEKEIQHS